MKSTTTSSLGGGCATLTELLLLEDAFLAPIVGMCGVVSVDKSTIDELPEGWVALGGDLCPLALGDFLDFPMFPMLRCDICHDVTLSRCCRCREAGHKVKKYGVSMTRVDNLSLLPSLRRRLGRQGVTTELRNAVRDSVTRGNV